MPADNSLILTQNRAFSYFTDMRDGVGNIWTTPSVNLQGPGGGTGALVMRLYFPSFTNATPAGSFRAAYLTAVVQVCGGDPATEANWRDLTYFRRMRPHVPTGSTGAGTPQNPVYSNEYIVRFNCDETNVRLSGTVLGSFPNFSHLHVAVYKGARRGRELD
ncbi:MAG TPA: hypothetical protein VD948_08665 [Rhodothermales bacterium]|nr:hypothetical protein [Rhodothermales bacterium]